MAVLHLEDVFLFFCFLFLVFFFFLSILTIVSELNSSDSPDVLRLSFFCGRHSVMWSILIPSAFVIGLFGKSIESQFSTWLCILICQRFSFQFSVFPDLYIIYYWMVVSCQLFWSMTFLFAICDWECVLDGWLPKGGVENAGGAEIKFKLKVLAESERPIKKMSALGLKINSS